MTEFITSLEDTDRAIKNAFSNIILNGQKVKCHYASNDIDLDKKTDEHDNLITIHRSPMYPDFPRMASQSAISYAPVYDDKGNIISRTKKERPLPYVIPYEVRTHFKNQIDGVRMNSQILNIFNRDKYTIQIKDVIYSIFLEKFGTYGTQYKNFGNIKEGSRKFSEFFTYKLEILFESGISEQVKTVQEINFKVDIKE